MQVIWLTSVLRRDLDHVHADHAAFLHQAVDQLARLHERDAAGTWGGDRWCIRRIHAVHVQRDVVPAAIGNARQHGIHADLMQLIRSDEMRAVGSCGLDFLGARAAGGAQADLKDLADVRHFGRASDGARQAFTHPVHFVAPIDVLIDLHQRDRSLAVERTQHRDRNSMVAAEYDRHRTDSEDPSYHVLGALQMSGGVAWFCAHIAAVNHIDRLPIVQRAAEVEVVTFYRANQAVSGAAQSRRRIRLVIDDGVVVVRVAVRDAKKRDVRRQIVQPLDQPRI